MKIPNRHSAGGVATAIKFRAEALVRYYKDPVLCKCCNIIIEVKDSEKVSSVRQRVFCSKNCSAIYNNTRREKKEIQLKELKDLERAESSINNLTKIELLNRCKTYASYRSSICKNARKSFLISDKARKCLICGYDKHTDIAHIKSVSSFPDDAKISEINSSENLMALCPNHHWEFDSGLIKI
jgi:hypothetical protein